LLTGCFRINPGSDSGELVLKKGSYALCITNSVRSGEIRGARRVLVWPSISRFLLINLEDTYDTQEALIRRIPFTNACPHSGRAWFTELRRIDQGDGTAAGTGVESPL